MSLSIIIPVYNDIKGVFYTLDLVKIKKPKILNQLIVVDDGSKDQMTCKIKDMINKDVYLSKVVSVISLRKNRGANFCRRLAMRSISSSYVMFLDSDDKVYSNFFDEINKIIYQDCYDFIFCSVRYFSNSKEILKLEPILDFSKVRSEKIGSHLLFVDNFSGVGIQTSAWVIRRSLVCSNFWKLYLPGHQDWFFLMAFFERNPFCKTYFCPDAVVERHTYGNRDHISKKLNLNYSYCFFKENIRFFSFSSSLFFFTTVCALKAIKAKGLLFPLGCSIFTINIVRKPFWRYAFFRLRSKYFNDK